FIHDLFCYESGRLLIFGVRLLFFLFHILSSIRGKISPPASKTIRRISLVLVHLSVIKAYTRYAASGPKIINTMTSVFFMHQAGWPCCAYTTSEIMPRMMNTEHLRAVFM